MLAGKLKERIVVETPLTEENELGEIVEHQYVKKFSCRAQVIYKSGATGVDNEKIFTDYSVQFIIRQNYFVLETDRVKYDNRTYNIDSIEKSREYQLIKLNCSLINE